jgi:hypothetical protein
LRSAEKPACISAASERASARAGFCLGQIGRPGNDSARYSTIASDSQTTTSPSTSAGHLPVGENFRISACVSGRRSATTVSSKGMPNCVIKIHGRSDQDE